jgi:type I restriction enzyme S subunit
MGVRVIRLQNIRRDGFDDSDSAFIDETYYREELSGHDVLQGDLLIAGLGDDKNTVGRTCVAPVGIEPAMVKADCFRFRLDTKRALPEFIATQLTDGSAADAGLLSSGSTRSRIPLSVMSSRKIALPPLLEQKQIASFLRSEFTKFDTLTAEAQRAIALLQERRTALISAAVTGKIDVRGQL